MGLKPGKCDPRVPARKAYPEHPGRSLSGAGADVGNGGREAGS